MYNPKLKMLLNYYILQFNFNLHSLKLIIGAYSFSMTFIANNTACVWCPFFVFLLT